MGERMTREQFLEKIFNKSYDELKGKKLRLTRLNVPAREINFAHVIGVARPEIYQNLSLHIGTHAGEDHTGESIGLLHVVPNEATIVAADVAMKRGNVTIGFLDRFRGTVIVLGDLPNVRSAIEGAVDFFKYQLNFTVCDVTEQ